MNKRQAKKNQKAMERNRTFRKLCRIQHEKDVTNTRHEERPYWFGGSKSWPNRFRLKTWAKQA